MDTATFNRHWTQDQDPLLTLKDLAARWGCSRSYIQKCDRADLPPRCTVLPGQIRYRLSDVLAFEASRVDRAHPLLAGNNPGGGAPPFSPPNR